MTLHEAQQLHSALAKVESAKAILVVLWDEAENRRDDFKADHLARIITSLDQAAGLPEGAFGLRPLLREQARRRLA